MSPNSVLIPFVIAHTPKHLANTFFKIKNDPENMSSEFTQIQQIGSALFGLVAINDVLRSGGDGKVLQKYSEYLDGADKIRLTLQRAAEFGRTYNPETESFLDCPEFKQALNEWEDLSADYEPEVPIEDIIAEIEQKLATA